VRLRWHCSSSGSARNTECFRRYNAYTRLEVLSVWIVFGQVSLVQTPNSNQQVNPFSISAFDTLSSSSSSSRLSYCSRTRPFGRHESSAYDKYYNACKYAQKMNGISHIVLLEHTHTRTRFFTRDGQFILFESLVRSPLVAHSTARTITQLNGIPRG